MVDALLDLAGREEVGDGLPFPLGAEGHALMHRGQKSVGPVTGGTGGHAAGIRQDHIGGEIVGLVPQSVRDPRSHHGKAVEAEAAALLEGGRGVTGGLGHHRVDDGQFVRHGGDVGKEVGDPEPALPTLLEFPVVLAQEAHFPEEDVRLLIGLQGLAVQLLEAGLVVKGVDLAEAPAQAEVDHPLGLGGVMGLYRLGGVAFPDEERGKGGSGQASLGPVEEIAATR